MCGIWKQDTAAHERRPSNSHKTDWAFARRHPLFSSKCISAVGANIYKMDPAVYDSYSKMALLPDACKCMVDYINKMSESKKGKPLRILDLCCGTGSFAREEIARLGAPIKYVGIDINSRFVDFARNAVENEAWKAGKKISLDFIQGDAGSIESFYKIENSYKKFDLVLGINAYGHIKRAKRRMFVHYAREHLVLNGSLILYEFCLPPKEGGGFSRLRTQKQLEKSTLKFYSKFLDYAEQNLHLNKIQRFALVNSAYLAAREDDISMPELQNLKMQLMKEQFHVPYVLHDESHNPPDMKNNNGISVPGACILVVRKAL